MLGAHQQTHRILHPLRGFRNGDLERWGHKMKRIGCITAVILTLGLALFVILPAITAPNTKATVAYDMSHLRQIGMACLMYAMDHNGEYPADWACLTNYANTPKLYFSRHDANNAGAMSNVMQWTSYVYIRGVTTAAAPETIVAYLPPGHYEQKDRGIVVHADCSVEWKSLRELTEALNKNPTTGGTVRR